ncbi:MAG: TraM recognition domain-containing protein, partial [Candidatus Saccharimonadales bacterium]
ATLFTLNKLLVNPAYRQRVVSSLDDNALKDFWQSEFNRAGNFQKVKMSGGVTAKISRFQRSAVTRRILEQPKSTINFDDIIQSGKILICNFAKGAIGEDTSSLLGISVLAKLQLAATRRSKMARATRSPFYLYVDEFQNFATESFVQMLSEARKFKLFLTMAEQTTAQQDQALVDNILANAGTVVCFRSAAQADARLVAPVFEPYLTSGDIANLPAFNFFVRIAATVAQTPMSGITIPIKDKGSEQTARAVIRSSRNRYTTPYVKQMGAADDQRTYRGYARTPTAVYKVPQH